MIPLLHFHLTKVHFVEPLTFTYFVYESYGHCILYLYQFHSWYTLGSIYSEQFKCQNDFLNRLKEIARDCSFTSVYEIINFLFLTHNQNTRVREELLKMMKTTDSLQDALQIAHLAEGTMHSEELSKQYLDTVKKDAQVYGLNQGKGNQFRS